MSDDTPMTFETYASLRRAQIAETVKQLCADYAWSTQQLADFLKWTPSHLAEIQKGQASYSLEELEMLCVRFGVSLESVTALDSDLEGLLHQALTTQVTQPALGKRIEIPLPPDNAGYALYHPVFAPHVPWVICSIPLDDSGQILAWDTQSGDLAWRYDHPTIIIGKPVFSPDGESIAFATTQDTVVVLNTADRTVTAILDPVEQGLVDDDWWTFVEALDPGYGTISALCFSPDGERLAAINEETGTLRLWKTQSWHHEQTLLIAQLQEQELKRRHRNPDPVTFKYAGVCVSGLYFTLDSQAVALWCHTDNRIEYFPLLGDSVETHLLGYEHEVACYSEVPVLSRWRSQMAILHLVGGSNQSFEMWETEEGSSSRLHREQHGPGHLQALKVVDHQTILAVIEVDPSDGPLTIKNMVNNLVVVAAPHAQAHSAIFSPDGATLAYMASTEPPTRRFISRERPVLTIQHLDLNALRDKRSLADFLWFRHNAEAGDLLRKSLPVGSSPASQLIPPQEISSSLLHSALKETPDPRHLHFPVPLTSGESLRDKLEFLEDDGLSANSERDGFFVAIYAQSPGVLLPNLAGKIELAGIPTRTVNLATVHNDAESLSTRDLAEVIVDRDLLRGEATPEVFQEIRSKYGQHVLLLDSAERLSTDCLFWLAKEARRLTRMLFLVVRDEMLFQAHVDAHAYPDWLEGRMGFIDLNELLDDR